MTGSHRRMRTIVAASAAALVGLTLGLTGTATAGPSTPHSSRGPHWAFDQSFGNDGIVWTDFPVSGLHFEWADATTVQPNGQIVAAGVASDFDTDYAAVARYLPDGTLDPTFGTGGKVTIGPHARYVVSAIGQQVIGGRRKTVLAVGSTFRHPYRYRCSVIRLNPDGSLDSDHDADPGVVFGDEGITVVGFADNSGFCDDMVVGPTGKIVVAVEAGADEGDAAVFRLRGRDGSLDPTFGQGGRVTIAAPGFQLSDAVALQPVPFHSPRIILGGLVDEQHGYDWALWRLLPDGTLDRTFGNDGLVVTPMRDPRVQQSFDTVDRVVVTPSGDIVAAGRYRAWPDGARFPQDTAAVARYLPDGPLDTDFGTAGVSHLPWDAQGETEADGVTLDGAGNILFAGPFDAPTYGLFLVGGLTPDGAPDRRFGADGFQEFAVRGGHDGAAALSLTPSGRLVVVGTAGEPGDGLRDQFGVVRLRLTGS